MCIIFCLTFISSNMLKIACIQIHIVRHKKICSSLQTFPQTLVQIKFAQLLRIYYLMVLSTTSYNFDIIQFLTHLKIYQHYLQTTKISGVFLYFYGSNFFAYNFFQYHHGSKKSKSFCQYNS